MTAILVIDDEPHNLTLIEMYLTDTSYQTLNETAARRLLNS